MVLTPSTWRFSPHSWYPDPRGTYSQSYWTGTRPIIIDPAAVDESMASVVETGGHTPVGQRDSERLPCREMIKPCRETARSATAQPAILFLRDPSSECLAPSDFFATRFTKSNRSALRRKLSTPMFSIAVVLLVILFPLLIPAAVTATHAITEAGQRRREQIANSLGDGVGPIGGQPISLEHTRRAAVA